MARWPTLDRLQPTLLDRFFHRQAPKGGGRSDDDIQIQLVRNWDEFRETVVRDLRWLFNSANFEEVQKLDRYPHVRRSVLNYGWQFGAAVGARADFVGIERIERQLRRAIEVFEPRILPDTIKIRANVGQGEPDQGSTVLAFTIECRLWAEPVPFRMLLRLTLDRDKGESTLNREDRDRGESTAEGEDRDRG